LGRRGIAMKTLRYSPDSDALYIYLTEEKIENTVEVKPGIMVDYDAEGKIVGIEVMDFVAELKEEGQPVPALINSFAKTA
jgi:uncharacterized protein YuzE